LASTIRVWDGTMPTSETKLQVSEVDYTPAEGKVFIMQGFYIYNNNASDKYGEIKLGATLLSGDKQIGTKETKYEKNLNIPLVNGEYIYTKGEIVTDLQYRIWGVEIDE